MARWWTTSSSCVCVLTLFLPFLFASVLAFVSTPSGKQRRRGHLCTFLRFFSLAFRLFVCLMLSSSHHLTCVSSLSSKVVADKHMQRNGGKKEMETREKKNKKDTQTREHGQATFCCFLLCFCFSPFFLVSFRTVFLVFSTSRSLPSDLFRFLAVLDPFSLLCSFSLNHCLVLVCLICSFRLFVSLLWLRPWNCPSEFTPCTPRPLASCPAMRSPSSTVLPRAVAATRYTQHEFNHGSPADI